MQCYTELTPPTAVTHSLTLPFVSADSQNLIVAKTSLLQIFKTKSLHSARKGSAERANDTKLVLVAEHVLSGTITSLVPIKTQTSKSGGEALLIGFKDAKLSLVEWDPERHGLSTISVHYFEQDELQGSPWTPSLSSCVNYLTVDPGSRCAALKFGARNLAILPFKQGDEDVHMDGDGDWDEDLDGPRPEKVVSKVTNGDSNDDGTPYGASFVMRLTQLDPSLIYPIHLDFLYEYREPTFGVLSSTLSPSSALLFERKDHLTYLVFTLDLHQRASTTILSVTGLPYDLNKVVPLPAPVGGALLVGNNELIHVDQSGKATGVGVNMFAKQCTSFGLHDQSDLDMRLEGSTVGLLSIENGEMLIILQTGALAILSFQVDGRSVSGLRVRRVAEELGGSIVTTGPSSTSYLSSNTMFLGSENGDSVVVGWNRKTHQQTRRKSRILLEDTIDELLLDEDDLDEEDDDLDDDLYGGSSTVNQAATNGGSKVDTSNSKAGDYVFRIHDSLVSIAPMRNLTFGKSMIYSDNVGEVDSEPVQSDLELVAATGTDRASSLAVIHQKIQPRVIGQFDFPDARGLWAMKAKVSTPKGADVEKVTITEKQDVQFDRLMIISKATEDGGEESDVYSLTPTGFEALTETEFDTAGSTIEAGTLGNGMRIIQVSNSEVRSYDGELGLSQILPMDDEDTEAELKIVSASFADPFLLLVRDDASIFLAQCDNNNELEEVEREDNALLETKWLTGCLYADTTGVFTNMQSDKGQKAGENVLMYLLSASGALHIYALPDLSKPVYVAEGLCFAPPVLSATYAARKSAARETLTEILVADLGDSTSKSPYLILRASNDDLIIYEPFRTTSATSLEPLVSTLHFSKVANPHLAKDPTVSAQEETDETIQESRDAPMRAISNLGGFSTVFLSGGSPSFILKSAKSTPKVVSLQGDGVRNMSSFHTAGCERGFIYTDVNGIARVSQLPVNTSYELGVALRKVELNQASHGVAYHPPSESYLIATSTDAEFELPKDDDFKKEWQREDITFKPMIEQSFVKIVNPINWSIIDEFQLDPCEMIMCIKTLNLAVSEHTDERRQLVTVGTALSKGEDIAIKGRVYVFDVVTVVPQPDRPETSKKLKLISKEDIPRGAVTGVSQVGHQGFMIVAQGQKCMIRGLKEDGSLLPVAFMDMNCYVTSINELPETGLLVMGDALKGVWVAGYTEEPYKMILLGKSATNMEVVAAEFFPDGKDLFVVVADADCNLHIMQYDPEHPKSLSGHLLLHRTTFSLGGHLPLSLTLLPRTLPATTLPATPSSLTAAAEATIPAHQVLLTTNTGALALLSPLSEIQYRKLNTLASALANTLYHACGLNPRAYRVDRDAPEGIVGARNVVDGTLLRRYGELSSQKRHDVAGRVGVDVEEIREDLMGLVGGLGYI